MTKNEMILEVCRAAERNILERCWSDDYRCKECNAIATYREQIVHKTYCSGHAAQKLKEMIENE